MSPLGLLYKFILARRVETRSRVTRLSGFVAVPEELAQLEYFYQGSELLFASHLARCGQVSNVHLWLAFYSKRPLWQSSQFSLRL